MTAAPAPAVAPVHQPAPPYVVRLRVRTHAWTSPGMPLADAQALREELRQQIADIGDGWRLITFTGRDGRSFDVRAREIVAVEVAPEGTHVEPPARPTRVNGSRVSGGTVVDDIEIHGKLGDAGALPDGTAWLKMQARHVPLDRR